jgi:hypothetical protein
MMALAEIGIGRARTELPTQNNQPGSRIYKAISALALVGGVAAALYLRDWAAIGIVAGCILLALAIMYMILARLFDWQRLSWREILDDIFGMLW